MPITGSSLSSAVFGSSSFSYSNFPFLPADSLFVDTVNLPSLGDDVPSKPSSSYSDDNFIPSYDGKDLKPLGSADINSMEIRGDVDAEEARIFRYLLSDRGKETFSSLRSEFKDLLDVKTRLSDKSLRLSPDTWTKLGSVLQRFSSTLLSFGRDRYHYGADLALRSEHSTSYYQKTSKLSSLTDVDWKSILSGVDDLLSSIHHASIGALETSDYEAETLGIILDKLLRGNDTSRIRRSPLYACLDSSEDILNPPHSEPSSYPLDTLSPLETGPSSSLKNLFPFFKYWKEKAESFVNSEKEINITMNISKFFEDMNVTMHDKTDTSELEDIVLSCMNRALGIALSIDK